MAYTSAESGYGAPASVVHTDVSQSDHVSIPDAELLFTGAFKRHGPDLVLTGHDGQRHVVPGYFSGEKHPALVAPNGASLSAALVDLLAGSPAPGQYAQAQSTTPPSPIGKVEKVSGHVVVFRNGVEVALNVGDAVFKGDVIQTGVNSSCGIDFPDGTALNLVANTRMALNDYSYDPNSNSNDALFSLVQGTFAFVAGKVAHTGDMKIETPVATMGIRGTTGFVQEQIGTITADVGNVTYSFAVVEDFGTGTVGQYELVDNNPNSPTYGQVVALVSRDGFMTFMTPQGPNLPPLVTTQPMNNSQLGFEQQIIQQVFQILNSGTNANPQSTPGAPGSSTPPNELQNLPQLLQNNNNNTFTFNLPYGGNGQTTVTVTVNGSGNNNNNNTNNDPGNSNTPTPTTFTWTGSSGPTWDTAGSWNPGTVPTAPADNIIIESGTVTYGNNGSDTYTVASLIVDTGTGLDITGGSLTILDGLTDGGTINVAGDPPTLTVSGAVVIAGSMRASGGGSEILFTDAFVDLFQYSRVTATHGGDVSFENSDVENESHARIVADHHGTISFEQTTVTNENGGMIEAVGKDSRIDFANSSVDNSGTLAALNGGSLKFYSEQITNETGGQIKADDGTIKFLGGGIINSGLITADDRGAMVFASVAATGNKIDVTNSAGAKIEATDFATIAFIGDRDTNGTGLGGGQVDNSGRIEAKDFSTVVFEDIAVTNEAGAVIAAKDHGMVVFVDVAGADNGGLFNSGTIGAFGLGSSVDFYSSDINGGTLDAYGGTIFVSSNSTLSGNVAVNIGGGGVADFAGVPNANGTAISVAFSGPGILDLGQVPTAAEGAAAITVTDFGAGDIVDLAGLKFSNDEEISLSQSAGGVILTITVDDQVVDTIGFDGSYEADEFALVRDPTGGTEVILGEVWTGSDGIWNTLDDWSGGSIPNESQTAAIDSPVRVTVNDEETVGGLVVDDHARLDIVSSGSLIVYDLLDNAATIKAEHGGELSVEGAAVFNEGRGTIEAKDDGTVVFSGGTVENDRRATIAADGRGSKVKFFGEDIDNLGSITALWGGSVLFAYSSIDNAYSGTIGADGSRSQIAFYRDEVDNFGLIGAKEGGEVKFYETHVNNEYSGTIGADGLRSEVRFARSTIDNAGLIGAKDGGKVIFYESRIDNENSGTIGADGRWSKVGFFDDQVENAGLIGAQLGGSVLFAYSSIENAATGTIIAQGDGSEVKFYRDRVDNSGVIGAKEGGEVKFDETRVDNKFTGEIEAKGTGSEVEFVRSHVHNSGLIEADRGGEVKFYETHVGNSFFGEIAADGVGSEVEFDRSHVWNSGLIEAERGGTVKFDETRVGNGAFGVVAAEGWGSTVEFDRSHVYNAGLVEAAYRGTVTLDRSHVYNADGEIASLGWGSTVDIERSAIIGGELLADGGKIVIDRSYLSDSVNVAITDGGIVDFKSPITTDATITFGVDGLPGAGALEIGQWFAPDSTTSIPATIVNFGTDDVIDLTKINPNDGFELSFSNETTLVVNVPGGGPTVELTLTNGSGYDIFDFAGLTDPWGGLELVYGALDFWNGEGGDGLWSTSTNWGTITGTQAVPGPTDTAILTAPFDSTTTITLDDLAATVANLEIGAGVTLDIDGGGSLTVTNALEVDGTGTLTVGDAGSQFQVDGPVRVDDGGEMEATGSGAAIEFVDDQVGNAGAIEADDHGRVVFDGSDVWNEDGGQIEAGHGGRIVIAGGTLDNERHAGIAAFGRGSKIGIFAEDVDNSGWIGAAWGGAILFADDQVDNSGRITAEHHGDVSFDRSTVDNARRGTIEADGRGARVTFDGSDVDNSGRIEAKHRGDVSFDHSTVDNKHHGTIEAEGRGSRINFFGDDVDNWGSIAAVWGGTVLLAYSSITNAWGGTIEADGRWSEVKFYRDTVDNSGRIEAKDHGEVKFYQSHIDNERGGKIEADGRGSEIKFDRSHVDNDGTIEAKHHGEVKFYESHVDNERGGKIEADGWGSRVTFDRDRVDNDGFIAAKHGGTVDITNSTIDQGCDGVIAAFGSGSVIDLDNAAIYYGSVNVFGTLNATGVDLIANATVTNSGTIEAIDGGQLTIDPGATTNTGTIKALANSTVLLEGDTVDNSDGLIEAIGANAIVALAGATIDGGTLASGDGGIIGAPDGATLSDVTLADGTVIDSNLDYVVNLLETTTLDGSAVFEGGGTFTLADGASISGSSGTTLSIGDDGGFNGHLTVAAGGSASITVATLIVTDGSTVESVGRNSALSITETGDGSENYGTIAARHGGSLTITHDGTATTEATGVIESLGHGSSVTLNSNLAEINDGTVEAGYGGTLTINVANVDPDIVEGGNYGTMEALAGGTLAIVGDMDNADADAEIEADGRHAKVSISGGHDYFTILGNSGELLATDGGRLSITSDTVYNSGSMTADAGAMVMNDVVLDNQSDGKITATDGGIIIANLDDFSWNFGAVIAADGGTIITNIFGEQTGNSGFIGAFDGGTYILNLTNADEQTGTTGSLPQGGNYGVIKAGAGGTIDIEGGGQSGFNNANGATVEADGYDAQVDLSNLVDLDNEGTILAKHGGMVIIDNSTLDPVIAGTLQADGGAIIVNNTTLNGTIDVTIDHSGFVDFSDVTNNASSFNLNFGGSGVFVLGQEAASTSNTLSVSNFGLLDTIDLTGLSYAPNDSTWNVSGNQLTITNGTTEIVDFSGASFNSADVVLIPDASGGTEIVYGAEVDWTSSLSGNWDDASWSNGGPSGTATVEIEGADITTSSSVVVTMDDGEPHTVANLVVGQQGELDVIGGSSLQVLNALDIAGTLNVTADTGNSSLNVQGPVGVAAGATITVSGGPYYYSPAANVVFSHDEVVNNGTFNAEYNGTVTFEHALVWNNADATIESTGGTLTFDHSTVYNAGAISVSGGSYGSVDITVSTIDQSSTGVVEAANGGAIYLDNATIVGGTLETTSGGIIYIYPTFVDLNEEASTSTFDGVSIASGSLIGVEGDTTLVLKDAIDNQGTIDSNNAYAEGLIIDGRVDLTGGGNIELTNGDSIAGATDGASPSVLINDGNTITGVDATIGDGSGDLLLQNLAGGTIEAGAEQGAIPGLTLTIDTGHSVDNAGVLAAENGNSLIVDDPVTGGGSVFVEGGTVDFAQSANVGTITFNNGAGTDYGEVIFGNEAGLNGLNATVNGFAGTDPGSTATSDEIELAGGWTTTSSLTGTGGNLTVNLTDGGETVTLTFDDFANGNTLSITQSGGDTFIFDPPATNTSSPSVSAGNDSFTFHHDGAGAGNSDPPAGAHDFGQLTAAESAQWLAADTQAGAPVDVTAQIDAHWHHALQNSVHLH